MTADEIAARLEAIAHRRGADWSLKVEIAHECAWSAELRWTDKDGQRKGAPDRSRVCFKVGCGSPEEAILSVHADLLDWLGLA